MDQYDPRTAKPHHGVDSSSCGAILFLLGLLLVFVQLVISVILHLIAPGCSFMLPGILAMVCLVLAAVLQG